MVEPFTELPASPSALALDTPVLLVDRKLATRRTGLREKGEEAHVVLAGMGIRTVGDLIRHYPRRYIDRSAVERDRRPPDRASGDGDRSRPQDGQADDQAAPDHGDGHDLRMARASST